MNYSGWDVQFQRSWGCRNCNRAARAFCRLCLRKMKQLKERKNG